MNKKIIFIFLLISTLLLSFSFGATEAKLVKTLNSGLTNIKSWIIKLSTPAAAVAIGTGVLMKKFSFGDEERIVTRKEIN
jgi:hypothetical protein